MSELKIDPDKMFLKETKVIIMQYRAQSGDSFLADRLERLVSMAENTRHNEQWISVETNTPDIVENFSGHVLVWTEDCMFADDAGKAYLTDEGEWVNAETHEKLQSKVLKWRYMPTQPNDEEV